MQYICQDTLYGGAVTSHKQFYLQVVEEVESLLGRFFYFFIFIFFSTTADAFRRRGEVFSYVRPKKLEEGSRKELKFQVILQATSIFRLNFKVDFSLDCTDLRIAPLNRPRQQRIVWLRAFLKNIHKNARNTV